MLFNFSQQSNLIRSDEEKFRKRQLCSSVLNSASVPTTPNGSLVAIHIYFRNKSTNCLEIGVSCLGDITPRSLRPVHAQIQSYERNVRVQ